MSELEVRVSEAKRLYEVARDKTFTANQAYNRLEAKTHELREEWLGLCEILKDREAKPYGHLTGLILLKQRIHAEYFRVRLARRRVKARLHDLSLETSRLYEEYLSLRRRIHHE